MRHARDAALDVLEPLLRELRTIDGLVEKKRGVFYRMSQSFLHFHEDPAGFFADVQIPPSEMGRQQSFPHPSDPQASQRLPVTSARQQRALVAVIRRTLRRATRR